MKLFRLMLEPLLLCSKLLLFNTFLWLLLLFLVLLHMHVGFGTAGCDVLLLVLVFSHRCLAIMIEEKSDSLRTF